MADAWNETAKASEQPEERSSKQKKQNSATHKMAYASPTQTSYNPVPRTQVFEGENEMTSFYYDDGEEGGGEEHISFSMFTRQDGGFPALFSAYDDRVTICGPKERVKRTRTISSSDFDHLQKRTARLFDGMRCV